jgi:hypothetical protein
MEKVKEDSELKAEIVQDVVSSYINHRGSSETAGGAAHETSPDEPRERKQLRFMLYILLGLPIKVAGRICGVPDTTAYKWHERMKKLPKWRHTLDEFLNLMPARYRQLCKLRLFDIVEIEQGAVEEYKQNPRLAIERPQLLKHLKQSSGAVGEDLPEEPQYDVLQLQALSCEIFDRQVAKQKVVVPLPPQRKSVIDVKDEDKTPT